MLCDSIIICVVHHTQLRRTVKAAAIKEKLLAKLQQAKDMATKRQSLIVKRAPSAYALLIKDRFTKLGHLPVKQRFQVGPLRHTRVA